MICSHWISEETRFSRVVEIEPTVAIGQHGGQHWDQTIKGYCVCEVHYYFTFYHHTWNHVIFVLLLEGNKIPFVLWEWSVTVSWCHEERGWDGRLISYSVILESLYYGVKIYLPFWDSFFSLTKITHKTDSNNKKK